MCVCPRSRVWRHASLRFSWPHQTVIRWIWTSQLSSLSSSCPTRAGMATMTWFSGEWLMLGLVQTPPRLVIHLLQVYLISKFNLHMAKTIFLLPKFWTVHNTDLLMSIPDFSFYLRYQRFFVSLTLIISLSCIDSI